MAALKNTKYEKFALGIFEGKLQSDAYVEAGFRTKNRNSSDAAAARLLQNPVVQARIAELKGKLVEKTLITRQVLEQKVWELAQLATDKLQLGVARECYNMLGRDKGAFTEHKKITIRRLSDMSIEEMEDFLAEHTAGHQEETGRGRTN